MGMSLGSGPLRALTMSVLLVVALGGCATSSSEKQYTNTGYDDENYDLRLCWKKFVLRRATDNRPMPREKYEIRDVRNVLVSTGVTNEKGETLPVRCHPDGPLKMIPVYPR